MHTFFPPELLDNIFSELENSADQHVQKHDWMLSGEEWYEVQRAENARFRKFPRPHTTLLPLLTVCKLWHDLSERQLYQSISIDEHATPGALAQLLHTLESSTHLAKLVRELRIHDNAESEQIQSQILIKCTGLTRLLLYISDGWEITVLKKTVSNLRGLKSLVFVREENPFALIPRGVTPTAICVAAELLNWLANWPMIEYITVLDIVNGEFYGEDSQLATLDTLRVRHPGSCSHLRHFCTDKRLDNMHLHALTTIAPVIASFNTYVDTRVKENVASLTNSLRAWIPQLESLSIQIPYQSTSAYTLGDDFCRQLRNITDLRVSACLVPPSSLVHFVDLVHLGCMPIPPSGLLTLAGILADLKSLKMLSIRVPDLSQAAPEIDILRLACDSQGILLKCSSEHEWEDW